MNVLRTAPGDDPIVVEAVFPAPPARVYRAWTQPEEIRQWFGRSPGSMVDATIDLRIGGRWRFVFERTAEREVFLEGEYLEIEPNQRLVFTWSHVIEVTGGERDATAHSRVTVAFEAAHRATCIRLRHEAIGERFARAGVREGWEASFRALQGLVGAASTAGSR